MTVPTRWQSVLPRLDYEVPPDLTPSTATSAPTVTMPLELVRQSVSVKEFWDIPEPVVERYRRYRPTPLWRAEKFEQAIGAKAPVYVKYEGGNISGSHKLNTALAQAYYYKQAGVRELVTGTGAGQWGTALAAACAAFGMSCTVFMVGKSLRDKPYRGSLMRLLGAEVHASPSTLTSVGSAGGNSLALAIGEAVEYARAGDGRAFCIGSGENYSILHQSVIGLEAVDQLAAMDAAVDTVVGCVGAGSNFGGIALPFFGGPALLAVESTATPKLTQGVYAYDVTDATGTGPMEAMYTIGSKYSIPQSHAAGLRFHGTAKLLSALRHHGQIEATAVGQRTALDAGRAFATSELLVPAPESGHALAAAASVVTGPRPGRGVLVCVSGHGLLDMSAYDQLRDGGIHDIAADVAAIEAATADLPSVDHALAEVK